MMVYFVYKISWKVQIVIDVVLAQTLHIPYNVDVDVTSDYFRAEIFRHA